MNTNHLPESQYLAGEREAELESLREEAARGEIREKVEALTAVCPRLSMGYLGNYERGQDYTTHYIFLPHSDRVGTYSDSVYLGEGTDKTKFRKALAKWAKLEEAVRRQYVADPNRLETLVLRDGRLFHENGALSRYAIRDSQFFIDKSFASVEEANAYMESYHYATVVK